MLYSSNEKESESDSEIRIRNQKYFTHLNTIVQNNKSIYFGSRRLLLRIGFRRFHRSHLALATVLQLYTYITVFIY